MLVLSVQIRMICAVVWRYLVG